MLTAAALLSFALGLGSSLVAASPISSGFNSTGLLRQCGTNPSLEEVIQAEAHFAKNKVVTNSGPGTAVASIPVYCMPSLPRCTVVRLTLARCTGHVIYKTTSISGGYIPDSQITASIDVLNADYAPCSISFFLAGTDRTLNPTWFDQVIPGK